MLFSLSSLLRATGLSGLFVASLLVGVAVAESAGEFHASSTEAAMATSARSDGESSESQHEHEELKNAFGVFVGFTHEGRRDNEPALGLEYTRRLSESFSIGGTLEYTFGDGDFLVALVPVSYYYGQWKFSVAPGVEDSEHGTEALLRFGLGYLFELESEWEINPQLNVDLVDGEDVWVLGVAFGRSF
jgi:hypothetical protein